MARLLQPLSKRAQTLHVVLKRCGAEEADHRECHLLRARRERPRHRRAAQQRDELAALHSNTSLARAANAFDIETPRRTAALRLIAMWNRVACSIGRSAGLPPLAM